MDELAEIRRRRAAQWETAQAQAAEAAGPTPVVAPEGATAVPEATGAGEPVEREAGEEREGAGPTAEQRCCRICFDSEESKQTGRLFSPCQCTGSMRFVHVSCLNEWRSASCNHRSYYHCDACHYKYRLQRLWVADLLISPGFHLALSLSFFVVSALLVGLNLIMVAPWVIESSLDQLHLPPDVRFLFTEDLPVKGNPACWHQGYTFQACCGRGRPGNPACWDDMHSFDSCCLGMSETLQKLRALLGPLLRVLFCGWLGLSLLGFGLYLQRQLREAWANAGGSWQVAVLVVYLSSFGRGLARLVALVGSAIALRELFVHLERHGKRWSSRVGERVLEVSS
ncbi:unnamed protein product [Durusdinium trenchii]|uniref:Uncharacterized protein n=2 Tax=Durusdinium trenchii TaxID=1381693 RepID=A0ABP0RAF0_9DINO